MNRWIGYVAMCALLGAGCGEDTQGGGAGDDDNNGTAMNNGDNNGANNANNGDNNANNGGACPIDTDVSGGETFSESTFPPFLFDHPAGWEVWMGNELVDEIWSVTLAPPGQTGQADFEISILVSTSLQADGGGLGEVLGEFEYAGEQLEYYGAVRGLAASGNFSVPYEDEYVSVTFRVGTMLSECADGVGPTVDAVIASLRPNPDTTFEPSTM